MLHFLTPMLASALLLSGSNGASSSSGTTLLQQPGHNISQQASTKPAF
jgi:hypothetical protein